MKERRAVALTERHRADLQPRDAIGPKGVAVERRVVAGPGKRRHHIGERTERAASEVQHAAGKTFRRKSPARGFQQRQPGWQAWRRTPGRAPRPTGCVRGRPRRAGRCFASVGRLRGNVEQARALPVRREPAASAPCRNRISAAPPRRRNASAFCSAALSRRGTSPAPVRSLRRRPRAARRRRRRLRPRTDRARRAPRPRRSRDG